MKTPARAIVLRRRSVLPLAAAALLAPQVQAQAAPLTQPIADALAQLDVLALHALQRTGVPGMAIAVVHQDQIVSLLLRSLLIWPQSGCSHKPRRWIGRGSEGFDRSPPT